jgi:hypothetical protein
MSGERRLEVALNLHETACHVTRAGIRAWRPDADAVTVERLLRQRIELARKT